MSDHFSSELSHNCESGDDIHISSFSSCVMNGPNKIVFVLGEPNHLLCHASFNVPFYKMNENKVL